MIRVLLLLFTFLSAVSADSLKIAGTFLSMNYEETAKNGNFLDSEKSDFDDILGLKLEYVKVLGSGYGGSNESSLGLSIDYSRGDSNYDGFLQSTSSTILIPFKSTTENTIIDPKIRWNEINRGKSYDVGVFTSLGYRYWERNLGSQYGYKEEYSWFYGDVGLKALFHDVNWHIGFEVAYQLAYKPQLHAEINGGLDFDLGNTSGYYYEIPLSYDINKNYSLEVSYKVNHWDIDASNVVGGYQEPQSVTNNQKINIGLVIKW
ncbi:hypothetical protein [Sulfurimonas sp.]|uniref:hypothetical protein n=1 Tax=Sulfurimonas sp. TaxID=2022749 RepID=UPI0035643AD8